jgi:hypothetical protein
MTRSQSLFDLPHQESKADSSEEDDGDCLG